LKTWKVVAVLGGVNFLVCVAIIGVGAAYDFLGRAPGSLVMLGVTLMTTPWVLLSKHLHHDLAARRKREFQILEDRPRDVIRDMSGTGTHRTLQAIADEHGQDLLDFIASRGDRE
jgi:hypothetical protein